jgi:hypothetical protein
MEATMAKKTDVTKEYPYDAQFPDNVDPTEENRRQFSEDKEKERKQAEKDAREAQDKN